MVSPIKYSVGADVSKSDIYVAMLLQTNDLKTVVKGTRKFANNSDGFKQFENWIHSHKKFDIAVHITMEATGNYHENLAFYFDNQHFIVNVVLPKQSSKRNGKTRISKKGNSHIRRILHLPALNVVRYGEKKFVQIYERIMSRHNKKMVAYVTIQRKLLALIYALWKKNQAYNSDYQSTFENVESKVLFPVGSGRAG